MSSCDKFGVASATSRRPKVRPTVRLALRRPYQHPMSINEKELRDLGYVETVPGCWTKYPLADPPADELPVKKRRLRRKPARKDAAEKADAGSLFGGTPVRIVVDCYRHRLLDTDNPEPKAWIDCLHAHGVITDDSPKFVSRVEINQHQCAFHEGRTEITVEPE